MGETKDRRVIVSTKAPAAIGPYSQALADGTYLFCSGQIALDPDTGEFLGGGIEPYAGLGAGGVPQGHHVGQGRL